MRKIILMMLLAAASGSVAAEWVKVSGNDDEIATVYVDPATVRKTGHRVTMWSLFDYKTPRVPGGPLEPYMSMRGQSEYDCKLMRSRALAISFHPKNMAQGELTYANTDPDNWRPVSPGSVAETLWKRACRKR